MVILHQMQSMYSRSESLSDLYRPQSLNGKLVQELELLQMFLQLTISVTTTKIKKYLFILSLVAFLSKVSRTGSFSLFRQLGLLLRLKTGVFNLIALWSLLNSESSETNSLV